MRFHIGADHRIEKTHVAQIKLIFELLTRFGKLGRFHHERIDGIDRKFRNLVFIKKGNHFAQTHLFCVVLACEKRKADRNERDGENGIQNDRLCISFHVFISSEDSFIIFQK